MGRPATARSSSGYEGRSDHEAYFFSGAGSLFLVLATLMWAMAPISAHAVATVAAAAMLAGAAMPAAAMPLLT